LTRAANAIVFGSMLVIAASVGVILDRQFGFGPVPALAWAAGAFAALALLHRALALRPAAAADGTRLAALEVGLAAANEERARLAARLDGLERRPVPEPVALDPVLAEVEAMGGLLARLADAVAAIDDRVDRIESRPAPAAPAAAAAASPSVAAEPVRPPPPPDAILEAARAGRIDLFLQPIVTLPQRKVRAYEVLSRLRTAGGALALPDSFLPLLAERGLIARHDLAVLAGGIELAKRLLARNPDVLLFANIAGASLADPTFLAELQTLVGAPGVPARSLVLEFAQGSLPGIGPAESEGLAALGKLGVRFSVDRMADLRADFQALAGRGFRFAKIAAGKLLAPADHLGGDIHPNDLSDLLARSGIELIVDTIEREAEIVDLLDFRIRLGQGHLFAVPRLVRPPGADDAPPPARKSPPAAPAVARTPTPVGGRR